MTLATRVAEMLGRPKAVTRLDRSNPLGFQDWVNMFGFSGNLYNVPAFTQTLQGTREDIDGSFAGLVEQAYKANGIVFACMRARQSLFSEARFRFRRVRNGKPGDLFGNQALALLEEPWPGATTGDLLSKAIAQADLAGNFFAARRMGSIRIMRPDWVTMVLGSTDDRSIQAGDLDVDLLGILYHPGGRYSGRTPVTLLREQFAHWAPIPDPTAQFRGMSWLTPVTREISGDSATTNHKLRYFENGATPNLAVTLDADISLADAREWIELFQQNHEGAINAYKTLFLGGGAKPVPVGSDLAQIDFKSVQGAGETRIAAAAGVPPIIVGLSEGLAAATYSNYGQARRAFADLTMRPLWRSFAGAMSQIIDVPVDAELWYDDADISFLQEDMKDAAEILSIKAASLGVLVRDGWTPASAKSFIMSGDFADLEHTGLFSVQLQPPMPNGPAQAIVTKPEPVLLPAVAGRSEDWQPPSINITFPEGFMRAEVNVEPAVTNIHEGAISVPVTVEPADVNIAEGAVQVSSPVTIADGAIRSSTPVTIADGAIRSETNVSPPSLTIEEGAVRVESPITVEPADVHVDGAQVTVEAPKPMRRTVTRNTDGQITETRDEVIDGD